MAMLTDSTPAPARTPIPFVHQPAPPVQAPRTGDELLAEIGREIDCQAAPAPRGGLRDAIAGAWRGIETDAARTREALQAGGV